MYDVSTRKQPDAVAYIAMATGFLALGAIAVGAIAIGSMAIGALAVKKVKLGDVEIDTLTVRRFRVLEPDAPQPPTADAAEESPQPAPRRRRPRKPIPT
jgi:hypothetical protein